MSPFSHRLRAAVQRQAIILDSAEASAWKAQADTLFAAWPTTLAAIDRQSIAGEAEVQGTLAVIEDILRVIAEHPPALPCHGVTHTVRVLSHALRIARRDELTTLGALRLMLAAAGHDLGRLLLQQDGVLRHADVSAVLFETLDIPLPAPIVLPARHAVLSHSAKRADYRPIHPRVIDDLRSADKLDALDEIGFIRAMIYQGANHAVDIRPRVDGGVTVLYGWWKNIEHIEPVSISARERWLIGQARERSRRIGREIHSFRAPAETLRLRFNEAVALVEPDANPQALNQTLQRLEALGPRQRANWAGLLTAIVAEVRRHEQRRLVDLDLIASNGRPDLAPFAALLLRWSHRLAGGANNGAISIDRQAFHAQDGQ